VIRCRTAQLLFMCGFGAACRRSCTSTLAERKKFTRRSAVLPAIPCKCFRTEPVSCLKKTCYRNPVSFKFSLSLRASLSLLSSHLVPKHRTCSSFAASYHTDLQVKKSSLAPHCLRAQPPHAAPAPHATSTKQVHHCILCVTPA
jgi:hypothetical protein